MVGWPSYAWLRPESPGDFLHLQIEGGGGGDKNGYTYLRRENIHFLYAPTQWALSALGGGGGYLAWVHYTGFIRDFMT